MKKIYLVPLIFLICFSGMAIFYFLFLKEPSFPDDIPSLIKLLGHNEVVIHQGAARKLLTHGKQPFLEAVRDENPQIRSVATHFLSAFKNDPQVQQELIRLAKDEYPYVRLWAAFSLGEVGNSEVIPTLEMLSKKDENENVQIRAKAALEKIAGNRPKEFYADELKRQGLLKLMFGRDSR